MKSVATNHDFNTALKYSLNGCQIATPLHVVVRVWSMVSDYRASVSKVVDLGAGDGRFAMGGHYKSYLGIEIDPNCNRLSGLPGNAHFNTQCAFDFKGEGYDLCIGNPPYIRHHNIDKTWLSKIQRRMHDSLDVTLSLQANLFLYFMCLAIQITRHDGLVALIVPFEWTIRPSAKGVRDLLRRKLWNVDVYRLVDEVFEGVLTTASIVFVDKSCLDGRWRYFDVDTEWHVHERKGPTESDRDPLTYENRGPIWAMRGLSPGTQKVFTLSEGQRIHNGLSREDVLPCVTTLKPLPPDCVVLDHRTFQQYYVKTGQKCWLIRSCDSLSHRLNAYLHAVPSELRNTATCRNRSPWYSFKVHPIPNILYASGFLSFGPKILVNKIRATPVGSVQGVYTYRRINISALVEYLRGINFESQIVAHAKTLKKIEVKQMNSVLNSYSSKETRK